MISSIINQFSWDFVEAIIYNSPASEFSEIIVFEKLHYFTCTALKPSDLNGLLDLY